MNEPPPVTERDDGYVQDRARSGSPPRSRRSRATWCSTLCAAPGGKATAMAAGASWSPPTSSSAADLSRRRRAGPRSPTPTRRLGSAHRRSSTSWCADGTRRPPLRAPRRVRPGAARRAVLRARRAAPAPRRPLADHRGRRRRAGRAAAAPARRAGAASSGRAACSSTACARSPRPSRSTIRRPPASTSIDEPPRRAVASRTATAGGCCRTTHDTDGMVLLRYRRPA